MKKLLMLLPLIMLVGCTPNENQSNSGTTSNETSEKMEDTSMVLKVDNTELDITWEDNDSVKALDELGELSISMPRYGGFEQVGSIGHTLVSNDIQMTTNPGDIVLYASNQLVLFFGSNSWSYTKLGHINMNQNELNDLLNKESVTVTIK